MLALNFWVFYPSLDLFSLGLEDEGTLIYWVHRLLQGQTPYRDFFCILAPGALWILGGWATLVGETLAQIRLLVPLTGAVMGTLMYLIGTRYLGRGLSLLAALSAVFGAMPYWPVVYHHWFAATAFLFYFWCGLKWLDSGTPLSGARLGVSAFLTGVILQTLGALTLLLIPFLWWAQKERQARATLALLLGVFGPTFLVLTWWGITGTFRAAIDAIILFPISDYAGFNKRGFAVFPNFEVLRTGLSTIATLGLSDLWAGRAKLIDFFTWPLVVLVGHTCYFLVAWVGGIWVIISSRKKGKLEFAFLGLAVIGMSLASLSRPDQTHIHFLRSLWWIILFRVTALQAWAKWPNRFVGSLVGLLLAFIVLPIGIQTELHRQKWASASSTVAFPRNKVRIADSQVAKGFEILNSEVLRETGVGETMFVYPWNTGYTWLMLRESPGRLDRITPLYHPEEMIEKSFQELEKNPPNLVVVFPINYRVYLPQYPTVPVEKFIEADKRWGRRAVATAKKFAVGFGIGRLK